MAPDLNSVPPSPRPLASATQPTTISRRTSQQMATSAFPPTSLNILPSNQNAVNQISPPLASPGMTATATVPGDNTGVGVGPGPLRHPRPLTAADLHLQLEKEQEAVVNRLTRELSMLRAAQNASVVSNSSSTSAGLPDSQDHNANHLLSGPSHPAPSQRLHHRSSSATSTRSNTNLPPTSTSALTAGAAPSTTADRTRGNPPRHEGLSLSRQNSMTGTGGARRSGASSPAPLSGTYGLSEHLPNVYHSRPGAPGREPSSGNLHSSAAGTGGESMVRADSVTSVQTSGRYEEAAYHRHELEAVKRENDVLKRRIRELERTLRVRRQSDASVRGGRSDSVSTTASISVQGRGRERGRDVGGSGAGSGAGMEDVAVGESAESRGLGR